MEVSLAFEQAVNQIGDASFLKSEFRKIQPQTNMKPMKKMLIGITALAGVFAAGLVALFVYEQWPALTGRPMRFTIAVSGQSGLPFTGVIKAGADVMTVSGVAPTNYIVTGHAVDCRFEKQQSEGALGVCLRSEYLNGTVSVTTSESGKGVGATLGLHNGSSYTF